MCALHPCFVFLDEYSVLCLFYLTTCVCVCHSFHGPLRECLPARRFRASLLLRLHLSSFLSCCTWRASCMDSKPKNKSSLSFSSGEKRTNASSPTSFKKEQIPIGRPALPPATDLGGWLYIHNHRQINKNIKER